MSSPSQPVLSVASITTDDHLDFIRSRRSASFLQTPAWGKVKSEWRRESIGWFRDGELVGAALVLYRQLPKVKRYLAYLPEGPVIDWEADNLAKWLAPMVTHLRRAGAFGVRMGPPVITGRWSAADIKAGIADDAVRRLTEVAPLERSAVGARVVSQLNETGWRLQAVEGGFAAGQPQYNFVVPLRDADGNPRTEEDILKSMNQQWRRNIKKSAKEGVVVTRGTVSAGDDADLRAFHALYTHTAERDHFTPRPLSYFRTMFEVLSGGGADPAVEIRLYLAHHEGDLVASTIWIRVGAHTWYSYGASSSEKREVRGSNAAQWAMIQDSLAEGADVYDLRGITDTLDSDDPHVGLIQFKVGTGGEAVEYVGEWDLPINRVIYKAFDLYMGRRGGN
ncbi:lipid II:glycine glycyltransferase (peptidoglycan interpeptide bridge formation enzyme) [Nocardioides daedukensis]|uniref:Lipid II:glycine glycyltransferase (Peptidoglycan interpeptide bridge formation enzyme) n=1 Tax=Nocardioides daedukensis TaxID=634462 RepID=A0A7Y9S1Q3_9ACTN|nr:lipid II:glycine glycyltransferase (peptidoglycan interpeptide bridge formation enzyme) [Nocardioides daedukensis]